MKLKQLIDQAHGPVHLWADGESAVVKFVDGRELWLPTNLPEWAVDAAACGAVVNVQPDNRRLLQTMIPDYDWEQAEYVPVIVWDARWPGVVPTSIWAMSANETLECGSFPVWTQTWQDGKPEVVLA